MELENSKKTEISKKKRVAPRNGKHRKTEAEILAFVNFLNRKKAEKKATEELNKEQKVNDNLNKEMTRFINIKLKIEDENKPDITYLYKCRSCDFTHKFKDKDNNFISTQKQYDFICSVCQYRPFAVRSQNDYGTENDELIEIV